MAVILTQWVERSGIPSQQFISFSFVMWCPFLIYLAVRSRTEVPKGWEPLNQGADHQAPCSSWQPPLPGGTPGGEYAVPGVSEAATNNHVFQIYLIFVNGKYTRYINSLIKYAKYSIVREDIKPLRNTLETKSQRHSFHNFKVTFIPLPVINPIGSSIFQSSPLCPAVCLVNASAVKQAMVSHFLWVQTPHPESSN